MFKKLFKKKEQKLTLNIETTLVSDIKLKELIKIVSDIQKEHSCNCTLNVNID